MFGRQNCSNNSRKSNNIVLIILLVIIILFTSSFFCYTFAGERINKNKIVVGYPLINSINERGTGNTYRGYNYEYLQEISRYTDWQYEFVVDSWDNCIQGLKDGTIDIMGYVSKNDERKEFLEYAKLPAGIANAILIANENNKELSYKDYKVLNGRRVGIINGSNLEKLLDNFCKQNHINVEKVYYETERRMSNALSSRSIELALSTNFEVNERSQIIVDFSSDLFYFAVSKTSKNYQDKIEKLNSAINEIFILEPDYNQKLFNTYVPDKSKKFLNFTEQERKFIKNSKPIKVVYDPEWQPLVYYNKNTNNIEGAIAYLFSRIEENTGLQFEYIKSKNYLEALEKVKNGDAWIITNFYRDYSWAENNNLKITTPYMALPLEKIVNKKADNNILVMPEDYKLYYKSKQLENKYYVKYVETIEDAYDVLASGGAKFTYTNAYVNSYLMNNNHYTNLETLPTLEKEVEVCMGVYNKAPQELISIIDKVSLTITKDEANQMAMKATLALEEASLENWIYNNPKNALGIAVAFFSIIFLIMLVYLKEKRNKERARHYNLVTGIWNFDKFCVETDKVFKKNELNNRYAILHINISKFKFLNDAYGFEIGNEVLRIIAKKYKKSIRSGELYGSLWADHFVCLLKCQNESELRYRLKFVLDELNEEVLKICDFRLVFRAGAYFITQEDIKEGKNANEMLQYANHALSNIGDSYKNILACFNQNLHKKLEELKLVDKDMLKAFYNKEFVPYYQPKYNIHTNEIIGAEALVRWIHPIKGIMSPAEFLPYFEKSGFIIEIDLYIFEEICKNIQKWIKENKQPIKVSCNFSRLHFNNEDFVKKVKNIAKRYEVPLKYIELELTETIAVEEMEVISKQIKELHDLGFSVSIDDFGSGYSSLSVLQQLNVDTIKLDKTFIENGVPTDREYKFMQAIINLAEQLKMEVICEGVETIEHVELLKKIRCDLAQGYYYSRPMPAKKINKLIKYKNKEQS